MIAVNVDPLGYLFEELEDATRVVDFPVLEARVRVGKWLRVAESMSQRAAQYQQQITRKANSAFLVRNVKFDGVRKGVLLEAKGPGYARFIDKKTGTYYVWFFKGAKALLDQARRQVVAAGGRKIEWHVAEEAAAKAMQQQLRQFPTITVVHTPPGL